MKHAAKLLILSAGLLFLEQVAVQNVASKIATGHFTPDAGRLKTGKFTYHDLSHGSEVGRGTITILKLTDSGSYHFSNDVTFASGFSGFGSQRWEAVTTTTFKPISAKLDFIRGSEIVAGFDLKYSSSRVTGYVVQRKGPSTRTKRPIDTPVPVDTVDQRIDWAAVLAGNLETGQLFEFNVYDPSTGVGQVTGMVGPLEQATIPAGTFTAYRIIYKMEKAGTTEQYQMLASEGLPRVMLREEFPNGVMSELIQVKEPTGSF